MTLLEKITREIPNARVEPAELNGRPAWRITIAPADLNDGGTFEALVYKDAASVQIRHLDAYHAARFAAEALKRTITPLGAKAPIPDLTTGSNAWKEARRYLAHFQELAGRPVEGDPRFEPPTP
jgi:hypothetical protein